MYIHQQVPKGYLWIDCKKYKIKKTIYECFQVKGKLNVKRA